MPLIDQILDAVRELEAELPADSDGVTVDLLKTRLGAGHSMGSLMVAIKLAVRNGQLAKKGELLRTRAASSIAPTPASSSSSTTWRPASAAPAGAAAATTALSADAKAGTSLLAQRIPTSANSAAPLTTPALAQSFTPLPQLVSQGLNIFLFHRDLRLVDNSALLKAPRPLMPVFIFTPQQIYPTTNKYFSHPAVQFMCASLVELDQQLRALGTRLHVFHGDTVHVLDRIRKTIPIASVTQNKDFSVFAIDRDTKIATWCSTQQPRVKFMNEEDFDIVRADELLKTDGQPYPTCTPYYAQLLKTSLTPPVNTTALPASAFVKVPEDALDFLPMDAIHQYYTFNPRIGQTGGRSHALRVLANLKQFDNYEVDRFFPAKPCTTRLSAHLKFGTISVRELYWAAVAAWGSPQNQLVRELAFRSLFIKICTARPAIQRDESYRQDVDRFIPWLRPGEGRYDEFWTAWVEGRTGFPLADAGMREMLATGFMHARARLNCAAVLTRYFLIDWREGARFFSNHLVDIDAIQNSMGWQEASALGENSNNIVRQPMNPLLQGKKYDPDCEYIKQWLPELRDVPISRIHAATWDVPTYPRPLVNQQDMSAKSMDIWMAAAEKAKTRTAATAKAGPMDKRKSRSEAEVKRR